MELCRLTHRAYNRRMELGDPVHLKHRAVRRAYGVLINNAKRVHWEGFLASLNERMVWMVHQYTSGDPTDRGQARIPPLKGGQAGIGAVTERVAETKKQEQAVVHHFLS